MSEPNGITRRGRVDEVGRVIVPPERRRTKVTLACDAAATVEMMDDGSILLRSKPGAGYTVTETFE